MIKLEVIDHRSVQPRHGMAGFSYKATDFAGEIMWKCNILNNQNINIREIMYHNCTMWR